MYYLATYYVGKGLIKNIESSAVFYDMFLSDIRIDLGKVKDGCADLNKCAYYIVSSTEKDLLKVDESMVYNYMYGDVISNEAFNRMVRPHSFTKTLFFNNPSPIIKPLYVYIATDQNILAPLNGRSEIDIKDIRFLSGLENREAGL